MHTPLIQHKTIIIYQYWQLANIGNTCSCCHHTAFQSAQCIVVHHVAACVVIH